MGLLGHRFSKFLLRYAGWQDEPRVLDGLGQFNERNVVVERIRFVLVVGHYSFHFMNSFSALFLQGVKLSWENIVNGVIQKHTKNTTMLPESC